MNTLKGLMLKDLYVFKNYRKNIYFSFIIFTIIIFMAAFQMNILAPGSIIFLIFFGMNSISTFSYDENAEVNKYLLALPISRKDIVKAKYLFTFLNALISLIVGFIISLIITFIVNPNNLDIFNALRICFIAFTSVNLLMCTDIPCIYKWGVEKGRMQSVLIPIILLFIGSFFLFIILILFPSLYYTISIKEIYNYSPLICLILNFLLYFLSYKISLKIFLKKAI